MKAICEGLGILLSYASEETDATCSTGHDELHVWGPHPADLSEKHQARLEELGWHWSDDYGCWSHFT